MRLNKDTALQVVGLIDMIAGLFPKKRKLRKLGDYLTAYAAQNTDFEAARKELDAAAAQGRVPVLTVAQGQALDTALDVIAGVARSVKRRLPS